MDLAKLLITVNDRSKMTFKHPLSDEFFSVPITVYAGDPWWIPENRQHTQSFLLSSDAEVNLWSRSREARLAGFYDPRVKIDGRSVAYFGYFECLDRYEIVQSIFDEFSAWAKSRGAEVVYGPINFNTFNNYRIRIGEHYATPPFLGEPYNPGYYELFLEELGYKMAVRYVTQESFAEDMEPIISGIKQSKMGGAFHLPGLKIESLDSEIWCQHLQDIYLLVDEIFKENFAYSGISFETFARSYGRSFADKFCPHSSVCARDVHGKIVGFFLGFPDYGPLLWQRAMPPVPAEEIKYAEHFRLIERPRFLGKTGGVHPDFRRLGLFNLLVAESACRAVKIYYSLNGCLMREDNPSLRFSQPFARQTRSYGLFVKNL